MQILYQNGFGAQILSDVIASFDHEASRNYVVARPITGELIIVHELEVIEVTHEGNQQ